MSNLKAQRCFNHAGREAVARCIVCNRFFCRECVTEHAGKMTCGRCLSAEAKKGEHKSVAARLLVVGFIASGTVILWLAFFLAGQGLLSIPSSVHEGTIWHKTGGRR